MKLSVIIPTFKRSDDLPRLFSSLADQTEMPEEILVVVGPNDTLSYNLCLKWEKCLPNINVIKASKPSVIHSINLGFNAAKFDIVCLLDDDVKLPIEWSTKIKNAFLSNPMMGAYGGRDYIQVQDPRIANPPLAAKLGVFHKFGGHHGYHHCGSLVSPISVDVLKGVNLSFRRSAFPRMQIDTHLEGSGAETCWELDLCLSIKQNGYENVYENENYLYHYWSPRLGFDSRNDIFSPASSKRIFNEAFILAKYRSIYELIFFGIRSFVIGNRIQPGVVWSLLHMRNNGIAVMTIPFKKLRHIWKGAKTGLKCKSLKYKR